MKGEFRCGYVALVGKPNTGKSTLMNALVGEKLSITAHRPQTTRHQILGMKTSDRYQCIFVDTPGIHDSRKKAIHRYMNRAATSVLDDADLICVLLDINDFNPRTLKLRAVDQNLVGKSDKTLCRQLDINADSHMDLLCDIKVIGMMLLTMLPQ